MDLWLMEFYEARMSEGMSLPDIDKMDLSYYLRIMGREKKEKERQAADADKVVYIDDLTFL